MKRILSVLLIALLATTAVFADWAFSGNFDVGYTFGFDGTTAVTAVDGDNTAPEAGFLYLKGGNEYLSLDVRTDTAISTNNGIIRDSGVGMTGTLNLSSLLNLAFELEMPVDVNFYLGNQSPETDADYAYVGYGSLVTVYAYGALDTGAGGNAGALLEVRTQPIEGIRANVGYVISALDGAQDFQISALADLGTLLGMDFSLDVSASYLANIDNAADNSRFMAAVTGGFGGFGAYAEYEYYNDTESATAVVDQNNLDFGVSYDITGIAVPLSLGADLAINDLSNDVSFGADVNITASILDLGLYAELGVEDFSDFDTGYVTVGTYLYF